MEFLPLGTVITLIDGPQKLMITGRLQIADVNEKTYDYCAVLWPQGYQEANALYLFDHKDIEKIWYMGMQNDEEFEYKARIQASR